MVGITSHGSYLPSWKLSREEVGRVLRTPPFGPGYRAVASHDEDTTTLAVEAARHAVAGNVEGIDSICFATMQPPYTDKTNATAIHAALGLSGAAGAYDLGGAFRSSAGALLAALDGAGAGRTTVVVSADMTSGLPGSFDESMGGAGAAALVIGPGTAAADFLSHASAPVEVLDRWRSPGSAHSRVWEERFSEKANVPVAVRTAQEACTKAGVALADVSRVVVAATGDRVEKRVLAELGATSDSNAILAAEAGRAGCAHPGLLLCDAIEQADGDDLILLVVVADGADAFLFKRTGVEIGRGGPSVRQQLDGRLDVDYATSLTWRGELRREPPRRPEPDRVAAPPSLRRSEWKFAFTGSRCTSCGAVHLPPVRRCSKCYAVDLVEDAQLYDVRAEIATFTIDHLAYSMSPPVVVAVVDFEGGGRTQCELTDVDVEEVAVGLPVAMTFRRSFTADGIHNYVWKARPAKEAIASAV